MKVAVCAGEGARGVPQAVARVGTHSGQCRQVAVKRVRREVCGGVKCVGACVGGMSAGCASGYPRRQRELALHSERRPGAQARTQGAARPTPHVL